MPRRQETLGPMTPIQDWEVERATVNIRVPFSFFFFFCTYT